MAPPGSHGMVVLTLTRGARKPSWLGGSWTCPRELRLREGARARALYSKAQLKEPATLSTHDSIKIPLAGEEGISWREGAEGEQMEWPGPPPGQDRVGTLSRILGCSAVPS